MAPNLPGFINSIKPSIDVGVGQRPYTFAWILGFAITSLIYVALSAILPDEVYEGEDDVTVAIEGKVVGDDVERDGSGSGEIKWSKDESELRMT